ncbi:hypothetical protein TNCV_2388161 [Trichonephila clavipes]|nr:hypothetical protein TNCV_2388161 [Trichonephila clavipes]
MINLLNKQITFLYIIRQYSKPLEKGTLCKTSYKLHAVRLVSSRSAYTSLVENTSLIHDIPDPWFTNDLGVLKWAKNPLIIMNALDDLRLNGTWKTLRWCLNVFEKIVAKHLNISLRLHISRRRRLMESIRRKRPQFWQRDESG